MPQTPNIQENLKTELSRLTERIASAFFVVQTKNFQVVYANDAAQELGIEQSRCCYQVNMGEEQPCDCP